MTRRTAENAPAHTIVGVVDKPGLRCRNEIAITERGGRKDIPKADWGGLVRAVADFQAYVVSRVPDEKHHPSQLGAHMIIKGTGTPNSHPRISTRLRPVRRQSYWDKERLKIRESLARQVYDVMPLAVGAASGDWQLSVV
jgi:hypothetical protein